MRSQLSPKTQVTRRRLSHPCLLSHPGVLLLDLSIQGDSSVITLGGTGEPDAFVPGLRTKGAERIAAVAATRTAGGFLAAAQAFHASGSAAPQAASGAVSGWGFMRGSGAPLGGAAAAPASFPWREHCVNVAEVHAPGGAPKNLFVAPGGRALYKCVRARLTLHTRAVQVCCHHRRRRLI